MALILKTNNGSDDYTHIPHPSVEIQVQVVHPEDNNEVFEFRHTWVITGMIVPGAATIQAQVTALHVAYDLGTLASAQILDAATPLETLPTDGGLKVVSLEFPEGKGPEWATKRSYKIVLKGLDHTSTVDTNGEYSYTITYLTDQSGIQTRTISGALKDIKGKAATAKYNALKSNLGWATWSGANLTTDSYSTNKDDTVCSFTVVHKKYWAIHPSGISNCDVNVEKAVDAQNVARYRVFGWFEGIASSCSVAIKALVPTGSIMLANTITRKGYSNRTSFNIEYIYKSGNNIVFSQESLKISPSIIGSVFKRVLGARAIKQLTSYTTARAIQTGVIKRLQQYPSEPSPHWSASNIVSSEFTRMTPEFNVGGKKAVFGLSYTYVFEFSSSPTW